MNDIHALLTGSGALTTDEVAASAAEIVTRSGRSLAPARVITADAADDEHGMAVARVDADGTVVLVSQDPGGPGVRIQVSTRDAAGEDPLVIVGCGSSREGTWP
jgi:hypothetical protein